MSNIAAFSIGIVIGGLFVIYGIIPFAICNFIENNVGKKYPQKVGDKEYEITINEKK